MVFQKDSLLKNAFKGFLYSFGRVAGFFLGVALSLVLLVHLANSGAKVEKSSITIMPNANGKKAELAEDSPILLQINITEVIGQGELVIDKLQTILADSRQGQLRGGRVKGILLYIDSPGGTVTDSTAIYRTLMDYKAEFNTPIYAYVNGLCASGSYMISCAADQVIASPNSIVGSIGVYIGPSFNFFKLIENWGIDAVTISQGKGKRELDPFTPWEDHNSPEFKERLKPLQDVVKAMYEQFVLTVSQARSLDPEFIEEECGAQIFIAQKALDLGLVDQIDGSYRNALIQLQEACNIDSEQPCQVVCLEAPKSGWSEFSSCANLLQGKVTHKISLGSIDYADFAGKPLCLYPMPALEHASDIVRP